MRTRPEAYLSPALGRIATALDGNPDRARGAVAADQDMDRTGGFPGAPRLLDRQVLERAPWAEARPACSVRDDGNHAHGRKHGRIADAVVGNERGSAPAHAVLEQVAFDERRVDLASGERTGRTCFGAFALGLLASSVVWNVHPESLPLPRVSGQGHHAMTRGLNRLPVHEAAGGVKRAEGGQHRKPFRPFAPERRQDQRPAEMRRRALGEIASKHRMRTDLEKHALTVDESVGDGVREPHGLGHVAAPVPRA